MGILNLNDDILMYTCAYLSSHDALALALSCKRLRPVALARVSRYVVLMATEPLPGGWKYMIAPDRARHIRTLRVHMPKYGYGGKKRPTVTSQIITKFIGVARGIIHLAIPFYMLLRSEYHNTAVESIYTLSNLTRLELSSQGDEVLDFLRTFPQGKLQVLVLGGRPDSSKPLLSTTLPAIAHLSGTLRALHILAMFHLDEAETALEASGKPLVFPHVRTLYLELKPPTSPFIPLDAEIPYDVLAPFPAAEVVKIPRFQLKDHHGPPKAPTTVIRHLELDPTNAMTFACGYIDPEHEYDNVEEQCVARYLHVLGIMRKRNPSVAILQAAYLVQPRGLQLTSALDVEKTVQQWNAVAAMMPALRCLALEIRWSSPGSADMNVMKRQLRDFLDLFAEQMGLLQGVLFLRLTFEPDCITPLQEEDLERFAATVAAATPTLRFLAFAAVDTPHETAREDDWYEVEYGLGGAHYDDDLVRWWYVVREGDGQFARPMAAADGKRIWRELIEEDEVSLEVEGVEERGDA